jgi:nucleotide-binding universal stress UspA family protein
MQYAIDARMEEAEAILANAVKEVGSLPCEVLTELVEGSAAQAIVEVAETRNSDLIVMGSRGHGTFARLLLGSTSQKVVAHAHCPVLIVR